MLKICWYYCMLNISKIKKSTHEARAICVFVSPMLLQLMQVFSFMSTLFEYSSASLASHTCTVSSLFACCKRVQMTFYPYDVNHFLRWLMSWDNFYLRNSFGLDLKICYEREKIDLEISQRVLQKILLKLKLLFMKTLKQLKFTGISFFFVRFSCDALCRL